MFFIANIQLITYICNIYLKILYNESFYKKKIDSNFNRIKNS